MLSKYLRYFVVAVVQPNRWFLILVKYRHSYLTTQLIPCWVSCTLVNCFSDWDQYDLGFSSLGMLNTLNRLCIHQGFQWAVSETVLQDLIQCFSEWNFKMHKRNIGLHTPLLMCCLAYMRGQRTVFNALRIWTFFYYSK